MIGGEQPFDLGSDKLGIYFPWEGKEISGINGVPMSIYRLNSIIVRDQNENDIFDSKDSVSSPTGDSLSNSDTPAIQETLKTLGIKKLEEIQSLSAAAKYLRYFRMAEHPYEIKFHWSVANSLAYAKDLAKEVGVPFDQNRADKILEKDRVEQFKRKRPLLQAKAAKGDMVWLHDFFEEMKQLPSDQQIPETETILLTKQALKIAIPKCMGAAEWYAQRVARGGLPIKGNPYPRYFEGDAMHSFEHQDMTGYLNMAETFAKRPELAGEVHFNQQEAQRIRGIGMKGLWIRFWREMETAAAQGDVEQFTKALDKARVLSEKPEIKGKFSWDNTYEKNLLQQALNIGLQKALRKIQNLVWIPSPGGNKLFEVKELIRVAKKYLSQLPASFKPSFDQKAQDKLIKRAARSDYDWAVRMAGIFAPKGNLAEVEGWLRTAQDSVNELKSYGPDHWNDQQEAAFNKQVSFLREKSILTEIRKEMAILQELQRKYHGTDLYPQHYWDYDWVMDTVKEVKELSRQPEVVGKISLDEKNLDEIQTNLLHTILIRDLKYKNSVVPRDTFEMIKDAKFHLEDFESSLKGIAHENLIKIYQNSLRLAKIAGQISDLDALAMMKKIVACLANRPELARQLDTDPQVISNIYIRAVQEGYDEAWERAQKQAVAGDLKSAEENLRDADNCAQHPDYSGNLRLHQEMVLPYPEKLLPEVIDKSFEEARLWAQMGHKDKTALYLKRAIKYCELAGIPTDSKRYSEVLAAFYQATKSPPRGNGS